MISVSKEYISTSSFGTRSNVPEYHPSFAFSNANPLFCSPVGVLVLISSERMKSMISSIFLRSTDEDSIILIPGRTVSTASFTFSNVSLFTRSALDRITISASLI